MADGQRVARCNINDTCSLLWICVAPGVLVQTVLNSYCSANISSPKRCKSDVWPPWRSSSGYVEYLPSCQMNQNLAGNPLRSPRPILIKDTFEGRKNVQLTRWLTWNAWEIPRLAKIGRFQKYTRSLLKEAFEQNCSFPPCLNVLQYLSPGLRHRSCVKKASSSSAKWPWPLEKEEEEENSR
jgi:hypothetical protein